MLSRRAFELLTTPHVETDERRRRDATATACGRVERDGPSAIGHTGGMVGFTALLAVDLRRAASAASCC